MKFTAKGYSKLNVLDAALKTGIFLLFYDCYILSRSASLYANILQVRNFFGIRTECCAFS